MGEQINPDPGHTERGLLKSQILEVCDIVQETEQIKRKKEKSVKNSYKEQSCQRKQVTQ